MTTTKKLRGLLQGANEKYQRLDRRIAVLQDLLLGIIFCAIALCLGYFTLNDMPKNHTWLQSAIAQILIIAVAWGAIRLLRRRFPAHDDKQPE